MSTVYTVGQVNAYISRLFDQDLTLRRISVGGEISNCKYHRSGHIYFTLKDETGTISAVMFAGDRRGLSFTLREGDRVVVTGTVSVYVRDGKYQLYAKRIERQGAGALYEKFLALKAELEEMGMFAPEYKRPIPKYVRRLGIVTAPTGAAVQDIRNISLRRNPYIQLILYPALVQGEGAAASIAKGLQTLDAMGLDAIIVGRGGGSIEDLWAFNEEAVARAIFACSTPVISAVGHETDTTIADFVADLRAPTPSAAAELAVADIREILTGLERTRTRLQTDMRQKIAAARERTETYGRLQTDMQHKIYAARERTEAYGRHLRVLRPENRIREMRQHLISAEEKMQSRMQAQLEAGRNRQAELERVLKERTSARLQEKRHALQLYISRLDGLSPIRKLGQGYSYAEDAAGNNVHSIRQVSPGDLLTLRVEDGTISSIVQETRVSAPDQ